MGKESTPITPAMIEAIRDSLKQLPPKPASASSTKLEAVSKLKDSIVAAQDRGYNYAQIAKKLSDNGLDITPRTLQAYMRKIGVVRRKRTTIKTPSNTTRKTSKKQG